MAAWDKKNDESNREPDDEPGDYIKNVGTSFVDLLTDISLSDNRRQKIANTMRIPIERIEVICNRILDMYDNEYITEEDLAFLITAPVADEEE